MLLSFVTRLLLCYTVMPSEVKFIHFSQKRSVFPLGQGTMWNVSSIWSVTSALSCAICTASLHMKEQNEI